MEKLFRYVVIISITLFVLYWLLPFVEHYWLTEEQLQVSNYANWGSYIPYHPVIYWGLFVIWIVISVGLFFFVRLARTAFVIMNVLTIAAGFFWGFRVLTPASAVVSDLVVLTDGVILTMAFLGSIASKFGKN